MTIVLTLILTVQMISAVAMIGLVLIQHGKGADMGAAFGSGSSGSLFGASGSANFMSRTTAVLASIFFVCTLALAYFGNLRTNTSSSVLDRVTSTAPALGASAVPAQIPDGGAPAPAASTPAVPASGVGQIPVK